MSAELPRTTNKMASKPIVYISRGAPPEPLKELSAVCEIRQWKEQRFIPKEELIKHARGAHALFVHPPDCVDAEVLDAVGMFVWVRVAVCAPRCVCVCVSVCV